MALPLTCLQGPYTHLSAVFVFSVSFCVLVVTEQTGDAFGFAVNVLIITAGKSGVYPTPSSDDLARLFSSHGALLNTYHKPLNT